MKEIRGKRLLLLGSSVWKDLIKQFADEYGVYLISAGLYPAPIDTIAQEVYHIDTIDRNVMIPFVRNHHIDGVYMGGSEFIISHACEWINEIGLPCYCEKKQWDLLQNKKHFKELCIKHGLPVVPKYDIDPLDFEGSIKPEDYPVITKPSDGSGSNGFSVCYNSKELEAGYKRAAENSPTASVICEKFVKNDAMAIFYSITEKDVVFCGSEDKTPIHYKKHNTYVAGLFHFPSEFETIVRCRYESNLIKMFKSIGLSSGSIWLELFHDDESYYFNEVGYRHGGSFSFYPIEYLSGVNQFYFDLYYALTGKSKLFGFKPLIKESIPNDKKYCVYPIHCNAGIIASEEGEDEIRRKYPYSIVVVTHKSNIGDQIFDSGSFAQIYCLFHFLYKTKEECKEIIRYIQETYKVIDTQGNNMVNVMLNINEI